MRKPLGPLAGAVLASALITIATAPAAVADDTSTTAPPTSSVSEETSTSSEPASTTTDAPSSTSTSASSVTTTSSSNSSDGTSSSVKPTSTSSKPGETTTEPTTSTPEEPPYVDNIGVGIDFGNGYGAVVIACAAGEPKNLSSADFDVVEGPYQDETDGRYWDYLVQLHEGKTFASGTISATWDCGPQGGGASGGGAPVTPVPGSDQAAGWQRGNGGNAQVSFAPRTGVETGFGGTAGN